VEKKERTVSDDISNRLDDIARDVHATHEMVANLHRRADKADERLEMLHNDHAALAKRVDVVTGNVTLLERLNDERQSRNEVVHNNMRDLMSRVEAKIDAQIATSQQRASTDEAGRGKLMTGVIFTLFSALAGLGVLLYQQIAGRLP
jgi:uncharacterized coiled-coil DUF342 family protein